MAERLRFAAKRLSGSGPAPSIGFLVDWLEDSRYHWQIVRGAMREAHDRGAHFIAFVGGTLAPEDQPSDTNWVYELARPGNVDGLVMLSGSLGNAVGSTGLAAFCARYPPMPICSIAIPLSGTSSVCIDNAAGMRAVIEHLIRSHGIRRIAFVRGPPANEEAELRLHVYRETLENSSIAYDPALVVDGDFTARAGHEAVRVLLDERALPIGDVGAIVGANDAMATGVIEELRSRSIRIPEQIAVAGFDDVEEARFSNPPLTTVAQRLDEQGRECVRIVLEQIRSGQVKPEQVVRSPELVTRRSCGCLSTLSGGRKSSAPPSSVSASFDSALIRRRQQILTDMARAARGALGVAGAQWEVRLLNAVADQVRGDKPDAFIRAYDEILQRVTEAGADPSVCGDVLSVLRARIVRCIAEPRQRLKAEDSFHEASVMTTHAVERLYVGRRLRAWTDARGLMQAGSSVLSAGSLDELSRVIHDQMPPIGIQRSFILRVRDGSDGQPVAQIVLAERPEARKTDPMFSTTFPPTDVLRQTTLHGTDERAFAVFPAAFADKQKALLVLELGATEGYGYEVLRRILTNVLSRLDAARATEAP